MKTVKGTLADVYEVKYFMVEFECPECGETEDISLHEGENYIKDEIIICSNCGYNFIIEYYGSN